MIEWGISTGGLDSGLAGWMAPIEILGPGPSRVAMAVAKSCKISSPSRAIREDDIGSVATVIGRARLGYDLKHRQGPYRQNGRVIVARIAVPSPGTSQPSSHTTYI
jgi:hypothetical protein